MIHRKIWRSLSQARKHTPRKGTSLDVERDHVRTPNSSLLRHERRSRRVNNLFQGFGFASQRDSDGINVLPTLKHKASTRLVSVEEEFDERKALAVHNTWQRRHFSYITLIQPSLCTKTTRLVKATQLQVTVRWISRLGTLNHEYCVVAQST